MRDADSCSVVDKRDIEMGEGAHTSVTTAIYLSISIVQFVLSSRELCVFLLQTPDVVVVCLFISMFQLKY